MQVKISGTAGTMESSDILVTIAPSEEEGISLYLSSSVLKQFGRKIEEVIRQTLTDMGIESALVHAVDRGALDCTIKARVLAATYRACGGDSVDWETLI